MSILRPQPPALLFEFSAMENTALHFHWSVARDPSLEFLKIGRPTSRRRSDVGKVGDRILVARRTPTVGD
jgi:hypothetical protein